LQIVG